MYLIFIVLCVLLLAGVWQVWELRRFRITNYGISTEQLTEELSLWVLADLHGFSYGKNNEKLISRIKEKGDALLIPGDLIVAEEKKTYDRMLLLLEELAGELPIFYSFGNHESRGEKEGSAFSAEFRDFYEKAKKLGVIFLRNENYSCSVKGQPLSVAGLELDSKYFKRRTKETLSKEMVEALLGPASRDRLQLLLAHNPMYALGYQDWGAKVTLCGHNHGGLIRLPYFGGIVSPQFQLFPTYGEGCKEREGHYVLTSRGMGTHTFHIRINNRAELIFLTLTPSLHKG